MKSSFGHQLERAELYSTDSTGKRIVHVRSEHQMPVRETRRTPNSTHGYEDREELMHAASRLTNEERKVYELLEEPIGDPAEVKQQIPAGDLVRFLRRGYTLVGGSTVTETRADGIEVDYVTVTGTERGRRNYERIGEIVGLTLRQVRRRVLTANKKLIRAIRG